MTSSPNLQNPNGAKFVLAGIVANAEVTYPIVDGPNLIGRGKNCQIIIADRTVSRIHARITICGDDATLEDCGSRNGTSVNQERVTRHVLTPSDRILLGKVSLVFSEADTASNDFPLDSTRIICERSEDSGPKISPAQMKVLQFALLGLDEVQIAKKISRSPHTVHNHLRAIYLAYNVHSRPELLAWFVQKRQQNPDDSSRHIELAVKEKESS